jgi:pimeloyl-ACP methyl ester carboxylesterase
VLERENAKKMVAAMPNGRLVEIDDSYHHAMLDNPVAVIATLSDFFKDLK